MGDLGHRGVDATVTVVSIYGPGTSWDRKQLILVRRHCAKTAFLRGDFNAHYESWRDPRSDAHREAFYGAIVATKLATLNDGRETFVRLDV